MGSDDPLRVYFALVYNFHDSSGDFVAEVFHALPSRKEYPEYYRIITEPIDLNIIKKNVDVSSIATSGYLHVPSKTLQY